MASIHLSAVRLHRSKLNKEPGIARASRQPRLQKPTPVSKPRCRTTRPCLDHRLAARRLNQYASGGNPARPLQRQLIQRSHLTNATSASVSPSPVSRYRLTHQAPATSSTTADTRIHKPDNYTWPAAPDRAAVKRARISRGIRMGTTQQRMQGPGMMR